MQFTAPTATVVPLILQEGRLKAVLSHHVSPDGAPKLKLARGEVDPDRDASLQLCACRLLREQLGVDDSGLVECRLSTGRDDLAEAREDVDGNLAEPAWGVRAIYMALLRPESADVVLKQEVETFDLKQVYSIPPFDDEEDEEDGLKISGRGIDSMILDALKTVEAQMTMKGQVTKLPAFLVGREFTLAELQEAYEAATGITIDPANFRRKVEQLDILHPVGERRLVSRRPTATYMLRGASIDLSRNIFGASLQPMSV